MRLSAFGLITVLAVAPFAAAQETAEDPAVDAVDGEAVEMEGANEADVAEPPAEEAAPAVEESLDDAATWSPRAQAWEKEKVIGMFKAMKERPLASEFLGSNQGMIEYADVRWAWFAEGFDTDAFSSVSVAAPRNGTGRQHVVGSRVLQAQLVAQLQRVKPWKKVVTAGEDGELTLYVNVRAHHANMLGIEDMVEVVGVDKSDKVVVRLQVLNGTGGAAAAAVGMALNPMSALPSETDQYNYITTQNMTLAGRITSAFGEHNKETKKGKAPSMGAAEALRHERSWYADQGTEAFGDAVASQVAELTTFILDTSGDVGERRDAAKKLGSIGSSSAFAAFNTSLTSDDTKGYPKALRDDVAWAIGEIGHSDGVAIIEAGQKVSGKTAKYALSKITEL